MLRIAGLLGCTYYILSWLYKAFRKVTYDNQTILITGASSGIGEQYALYLSQFPNTKLILASNELEELQKVKDNCKHPQNVTIYYIDLTNLQATEEVCQQIISNSITR